MISILVLLRLGVAFSLVAASSGLKVVTDGPTIVNGTHRGSVTVYDIGPKNAKTTTTTTTTACGGNITDIGDQFVALPQWLFDDFPNAKVARPNPICSRKVELITPKAKHVLNVKAICSECKGWNIAVSEAALTALAPQKKGIVDKIEWHFLDPKNPSSPKSSDEDGKTLKGRSFQSHAGGSSTSSTSTSKPTPVAYPRRGASDNDSDSGTAAPSSHKFARRMAARRERKLERRGQDVPEHRVERRKTGRASRLASEMVTRVL